MRWCCFRLNESVSSQWLLIYSHVPWRLTFVISNIECWVCYIVHFMWWRVALGGVRVKGTDSGFWCEIIKRWFRRSHFLIYDNRKFTSCGWHPLEFDGHRTPMPKLDEGLSWTIVTVCGPSERFDFSNGAVTFAQIVVAMYEVYIVDEHVSYIVQAGYWWCAKNNRS